MFLAPRFRSPLALLAVSVVLAACGSDADKSNPAPAGGGSSASSAESNEQDSASVELNQCLREETGIDVTDAQGHEVFADLTPPERQRLQAALDGPCATYGGQAFGDVEEAQSQSFLDALTLFTTCMRENGADVPDPDPNAPFTVLHSLDQSDPTIARAMVKCQDNLAALRGGG